MLDKLIGQVNECLAIEVGEYKLLEGTKLEALQYLTGIKFNEKVYYGLSNIIFQDPEDCEGFLKYGKSEIIAKVEIFSMSTFIYVVSYFDVDDIHNLLTQ